MSSVFFALSEIFQILLDNNGELNFIALRDFKDGIMKRIVIFIVFLTMCGLAFGQIPLAATLIQPLDGQNNVPLTPPRLVFQKETLAGGYTVSARVFFGISNILTEFRETDANFYQFSEQFAPNTTYFWRVVTFTELGEGPSSDTWSFTTGSLGNSSIPVTLPYEEDFESENHGWTFVNGTQQNKWCYGTATAYRGVGSIYISNDGGITNNYTYETAPSIVFAYRDVIFPPFAENIKLEFYFRGIGEYREDYMSVYLLPENTTVSSISLPSANYLIGNDYYCRERYWTKKEIAISKNNAGQTKRLVFMWVNNHFNSSFENSQPPAAIDNLIIKQGYEQEDMKYQTSGGGCTGP
jgi:hypothetical protein